MSYVKYPNRSFIALAVILALAAYLYMRYYQQVGLSPLSSHTQNVRFLDSKIPLLIAADFEVFSHTPTSILPQLSLSSNFIVLEDEYASIGDIPPRGWIRDQVETVRARETYELVKQETISWRANFHKIFVQRSSEGVISAIDFWIVSDTSFPPPYFLSQSCPGGNCVRIYRYENPAVDEISRPESRFSHLNKVSLIANWYYMD